MIILDLHWKKTKIWYNTNNWGRLRDRGCGVPQVSRKSLFWAQSKGSSNQI